MHETAPPNHVSTMIESTPKDVLQWNFDLNADMTDKFTPAAHSTVRQRRFGAEYVYLG
jgi:hypothetical protein